MKGEPVKDSPHKGALPERRAQKEEPRGDPKKVSGFRVYIRFLGFGVGFRVLVEGLRLLVGSGFS